MYITLGLTSDNKVDKDNLHSKIQDSEVIFDAQISYINASSVLTVFFHVTDSVVELLQLLHVPVILDICKDLMASNKHGIKFFSDKQIKTLKNCKNTPLLLQRLSIYFTWSNHSILRIRAKTNIPNIRIRIRFGIRS